MFYSFLTNLYLYIKILKYPLHIQLSLQAKKSVKQNFIFLNQILAQIIDLSSSLGVTKGMVLFLRNKEKYLHETLQRYKNFRTAIQRVCRK